MNVAKTGLQIINALLTKGRKIMTELSLSNSELGKSIIEIAEQKRKNKLQEATVSTVEALMNQIEGQDQIAKRHIANRDFYQRRLTAIEKGEFDLVQEGWRTIKYHDEELNRQDM